MGLTVLNADEFGRINGFKTEYGEELVPWGFTFGCVPGKLGASHSCCLNTSSWPMLGGKAASATQRKGFPESGPEIPAALFYLIHFQSATTWCKTETFDSCFWFFGLAFLPVKVGHGRQCTGYLACALSCQGIKGSLFWRCVWDSIILLQWTADCGYFDWIHEKQTRPKCDKMWRKRPRDQEPGCHTFGQSKR